MSLVRARPKLMLQTNNQVVIYNQTENTLVVNQRPSICPTCGSFNRKPFLDDSYFHLLEEQHPKGYYDRFFIELQKLGRGQRGSVFLVQHILNQVELGLFAIKAIPVGESHEWLVRMVREVTLLGKLKHPNIIEYKHAWLESRQLNPFVPNVPCLFILMEYANCGNVEEYIHLQEEEDPTLDRIQRMRQKAKSSFATLKEKFDVDVFLNGGIGFMGGKKTRFLTNEEIRSFMLDICRGLDHLHHQKIIHRDIKPPNLLLHYPNDERVGIPRVLLSDFGECEMIEEWHLRTGATGTLEFMPPELLQKDPFGNYIPNHEQSADVWSLGVVFYYLCFSKIPYSQSEDVDLLKNEILHFDINQLQFQKCNRVSEEYTEIIYELMDMDPYKRPNVSQVIQRLEYLQQLEKSNVSFNSQSKETKNTEMKDYSTKKTFDTKYVFLFLLQLLPLLFCDKPKKWVFIGTSFISMGIYVGLGIWNWIYVVSVGIGLLSLLLVTGDTCENSLI